MRLRNSGRPYTDAQVKKMISILPNQTKLARLVRELEHTPLQIKTFLLCAMSDRKRNAKGWPKADRAARKARVLRVSCGRAQKFWTMFKRFAEANYDRDHGTRIKVPASRKWEFAMRMFSEGSPVVQR
jgi:hypothetical protein